MIRQHTDRSPQIGGRIAWRSLEGHALKLLRDIVGNKLVDAQASSNSSAGVVPHVTRDIS